MKSMYIIIESDTLDNAKLRFKELVVNLGYNIANYNYVVGDAKIGYANGKIIRNNTVLSDWKNGNFCFEVDCNIVEQYGSEIEAEILKHTDTHWVDNIGVREFMPEVEVI